MRAPTLTRRRLGAALIATSVVSGSIAIHLTGAPLTRPAPAVTAWLAGMLTFLAGAALLDGPPRRLRVAWAEVAVVTALTAVALAARLPALDTIPRTFSGDEGEMGEVARTVLRGELVDPFATGWLSHPTLWFFAQAGSLRAFGDDVVGLRTLSALIGAATVPALYAFARLGYGRATATVAAALLAVYHVHVHYSRIGLNNVADALPGVLAFTALLLAIRRSSWLGFAGAGVALGLSSYLYMGARLLPLVTAAVLAHLLLVERRRLRALGARIALLPLGFVLAAGPLLHWFANRPDTLRGRLEAVGLFQNGTFDNRRAAGESAFSILRDQFERGIGAYTSAPDRTSFYDPGMPLLDPVSATLFTLGLLALVVAWRRSESVLLASWLLGTAILGGMLLADPPHSTRYVNAAPAVCLVAAIGVVAPVRLLGRATELSKRKQYALIAAVVAALAAWNVAFYFREYTPRLRFGGLGNETATALAHTLAARPPNTYVYLFARQDELYLGHGTIRFIAPGRTGFDVQPGASADSVPPVSVPHLYAFTAARFADVESARAREPGGRLGLYRSRVDGRPLFATYEPPR